MIGLIFDDKDRKRFDQLRNKMLENRRSADLFSIYLNRFPELVKPQLVKEIADDCGVSSKIAVASILSAAFGIDSERSPEEREFERKYIDSVVHILDINTYASDPYYTNIKVPAKDVGRWSFVDLSYSAYEGFVFSESVIKRDHSEVQSIGFFEEKFSFPAVLENGREWMAIKPNEIETMRQPIEEVSGKVVTLGLGMGYFAYMASLKSDVTSVTVVERDPSVIELFETHILPQFEYKDKIKIVKSDAFDYLNNNETLDADYLFADLWHDASDGLALYQKLKKYEGKFSSTEFLYWIEHTLLSYMRDAIIYNDSKRLSEGMDGAAVCAKVIKGFDDYLHFLGNELPYYLRENDIDLFV